MAFWRFTQQTGMKQPLKNYREIYQFTKKFTEAVFILHENFGVCSFSVGYFGFCSFGGLWVVFHFLFEDFFEGFVVDV